MRISAAHRQAISLSIMMVGLAVIAINIIGKMVPLRAPEVTGYVDFAGGSTRSYAHSMAALARLKDAAPPSEQLVEEATRIFHEGIAHIAPDDIVRNGYSHYGMRVPVTENWVLFLLSIVKPDTYRDYEFCHYSRVLKRGTGRCGQNALGLVSFLSSLDMNAGFVALGGHAIAMAEVSPGVWYLLDPDYGGVIPFGIEIAESNPEAVLQYYWSDAARMNRIDRAFAPDRNEIKLGGPKARYPRACPIESASYVIKWAVPTALILLGVLLLASHHRLR